jgi:hypothetical protein
LPALPYDPIVELSLEEQFEEVELMWQMATHDPKAAGR